MDHDRKRTFSFRAGAPIALLALASCSSLQTSSGLTSVLAQLLGVAILVWVVLLIA
jgi:hypothetical protein